MVFTQTEDNYSSSDTMSHVGKHDEERADVVEVVPQSYGQHLANPAPLAMGGFATTLLTVSLAMMNFRGVSNQTIFVGDLCFVACIGLLISAQWSMVKGDTFSYTVLSAFGLFYGGYGAMMIPGLGIIDSFGGYTAEYYNAFGFFILLWAVLNIFFLIASVRFNLVYVAIFTCLEVCFTLDASSYFAMADGHKSTYDVLQKAAGAFAFIASVLGYYTVLHYLCQDVLPFKVSMGDTSRFFTKGRKLKA